MTKNISEEIASLKNILAFAPTKAAIPSLAKKFIKVFQKKL